MDGKSVAVGSRPVKMQSRVEHREVEGRGKAEGEVSGGVEQRPRLRGRTGWLGERRGTRRAAQVRAGGAGPPSVALGVRFTGGGTVVGAVAQPVRAAAS